MMRTQVFLAAALCALTLLLVTCSDKEKPCCAKLCAFGEVACGNDCIKPDQDCAWPADSGYACERGSSRRPCPAADNGGADLPPCVQPPNITYCDAPPNHVSTTYYYCWGCTCAGGDKTAGCNTQNGDCRYFATGCMPKSYRMCTPENVQKDQALGGLCGFCIFREAGPGHCNKLVEIGVGPKDQGTKPQ
jgi:hypothetical protein